MKALIVLSGGMDSVTLLHEYSDKIKMAVNFNYGSNHNEAEYFYAKKNCDRLNIPLIRLDLRDIFKNIKSNLLQGADAIPEGHYADDNMKKTVVPFRNGIMLSICAGIAASNELDTILIGNHAGDHTIYPDCRPDFIHNMTEAVKKGLWEYVNIMSPYQFMTKREIALQGQRLGVNYVMSYTCYKGGHLHCGKCGSCTERKEALEGFDRTEYEA